MRTIWIVFIVALVATICVAGDEENKKANKKQLQIGIKKKVEDCKRTSKKGDSLSMHYVGKLEDGTEFDSSVGRNQPFEFTLGVGQVIKGWDQGLLDMCEGEKRKLIIPSHLGYGDRGAPPKIPGNLSIFVNYNLFVLFC